MLFDRDVKWFGEFSCELAGVGRTRKLKRNQIDGVSECMFAEGGWIASNSTAFVATEVVYFFGCSAKDCEAHVMSYLFELK